MRKYAFLIKYFVSYVLVLVLPLCVLFGVLYANSIRLIEDNFRTVQRSAVLQARDAIEIEMERVYEILPRIKLSKQFSIVKLDSASYEYIAAIDRLKDYVVYSNIISSAVVYNGDDHLAISERGTFPARYFGSEICVFEEYTAGALRTRIHQLAANAVSINVVTLVDGKKERCLVHWYPFEDYANQAGSILMVFIGLGEVDGILDRLRAAEEGVFTILNPSGEAITATGAPDIDTAAILPQLDLFSGEVQMVEQGDASYFVAHSVGVQSGWTYLYAVPYEAIANDLMQMRTRYFTVLAGLLALSSVLIYGFLRLNYVPIKRLQQNVKAFLHMENNLNEIDTIQEAFLQLADRIQWINERIRQEQPALQSYGIQSLLRGEMPDVLYAEALGIDGTQAWLVALVCTEHPGGLVYLAEHAPLCLGKDAALCLYPLVGEGSVLLLAGYPDGGTDDARRALWLLASGYLGATGARLSFFIGGIGLTIQDIPRAVSDALEAGAVAPLAGGVDVLTYSDAALSLAQIDASLEEMAGAVEAAVITRDGEALLSLAERVQHTDWTRTNAAQCCAFLRRLPTIVSKNIRDEAIRQQLLKATADCQYRYLRNQCPEAFMREAAQAIRVLAHGIASTGRHGEVAAMLARVLSSVESDYLKPDFSLASVADALNVSPSWLSHFFKAQMHTTLIEYVNGKKMERARLLLRESDISLAALAEALGYQSVSSFIRSFKKDTHMTPGQYRATSQKKENMP